MKKVVCPQCGLVNLEKFVTFPHCAACGVLLTPSDEQTTPLWKRPILTALWAGLVGLCCLALAVLGLSIAREARPVEAKQLLIYVQLPRRAPLGETQIVQFSLDTTVGNSENITTQFEDVRLRLSHSTLENFEIKAMMPTPDIRSSSGSGRYFQWKVLPLQRPIRFLIAPRIAGNRILTCSLYARGCQPFNLKRIIYVPRREHPKLPNLIPQTLNPTSKRNTHGQQR